jgi:DNA-binding transcriptional LysR family regulator
VDVRELGRLDLNLLVALEALLEERSVSRAAERLFITQSAMSKTLGRLRELFVDPLFVRSAAGMMPTPRAEQLAEQLPLVLQAVQDLLAPEKFDPLQYTGQFNLLVQGHMGQWLVPMLVQRLTERAPRIRFTAMSHVDRPFEQLHQGTLDFIFQVALHDYPAELRLTTLGFAPPLLLARRGHPLEGREPGWDELLTYPHVQLATSELADIHFVTSGDSLFMRHLSEVVPNLRTDQLLTAVEIVRSTDYLFPAPPLYLEQADLSEELIALPLPEREQVMVKYVMVNHQRINSSAAHDFLYREILVVVEQFRHRHGLCSLGELRRTHGLEY